ncbi:MAG: beta-lactamase family protein [Proteobacteria bacterium]|nr:beta-lactamase family protein [Pseudomonadota bacterium]
MNRVLPLCLLVGSTTISAAECNFSSVDLSVENLLQSYPVIPGIGLKIAYPNEVIYEKYWGQYDNNTVVPLASATKLLSAVTIMSLVDENLIDLDLPVSHYLPQFTADKGLMTVRQMFSHTAGMPDNARMLNKTVLNARNGLSLEQAVDFLACCEPLLYQPGEGFAYGGASMHIAGRVAEVVAEKSWIDVFNQNITIPLNISSMDFNGLGVTQNYRIAGGAQSSLPDYSKVLNMLLNKGRYQSTRILSEQAVATMLSDNVADLDIVYAPPSIDEEVKYGMGTWLIFNENNNLTSLYSPGAFGFTPWVDYDLNYYAAFMVKDFNSRMAAPIVEIRNQIRQILTENWCGSQAPELTDELGLWYDPNFSGHGVEIQKVGAAYSGVFYTFSESGKPEWYLLSVADQTDNLTGTLLRVGNSGSSENIVTNVELAGTFSINFNLEQNKNSTCASTSNNVTAEMTWSINDEQGFWCIQPLITVNSRAKTNQNGWWWNGSEDSGWGFNVYTNDAIEFRTVYYYDESGNPIWAFASNETESEVFNIQAPTGYCRTCVKTPLQTRDIGQFKGVINVTSITTDSQSTISLDIEGMERLEFIPKIFSNPAY